MKCEWRNISGYEGSYQVSNMGQVRSLKRGNKILAPSRSRSGYLQVNLYRNGQPQHFYVHRLVAAAFLGPIPWWAIVDHVDGNKLNNNADNLRFLTLQENVLQAHKLGLVKRGRIRKGMAIF